MDVNTLYHRTVECWADQVNAVGPDQWEAPTPCADWTVRDLVNHVVGEDRWTVPLMEGRTIDEVGSSLDGDLLGADPIDAALEAAKAAVSVVAERLPEGRPVHLSYGEERPEEYIRQLAADHLVHAWDLAVAVGGDTRLDPNLVDEVAAWFADREELYRSAGAVGPHRAAATGDAQADLLGAFGRSARWGANDATLARFSRAFGARDVDAIMALMTDDCVFESTSPAPDGRRHEGADAVRAVWVEVFGTPDAAFTEEESLVCDDRGVLRWRFSWSGPDGTPGHVRGIDLLRFRDGKVCEKLSYVKG